MTITLDTLNTAFPSLGKFANEPKLSLKQKYWISKLVPWAEAEMKILETARRELIAQYDAEDKTWRENPERATAFQTEFDELLKVEIECPREPFKLAELPEELSLTAVDLARLNWLIEE